MRYDAALPVRNRPTMKQTFLDFEQPIAELQTKIGRDPGERTERPPREPRQHTPQFLQRGPTTPRSPVGTDDDDEFEED